VFCVVTVYVGGVALLSPSPFTEQQVEPTVFNPSINFNYFNELIDGAIPENTLLQIQSTDLLLQPFYFKNLFQQIDTISTSLKCYIPLMNEIKYLKKLFSYFTSISGIDVYLKKTIKIDSKIFDTTQFQLLDKTLNDIETKQVTKNIEFFFSISLFFKNSNLKFKIHFYISKLKL
jgi:hypothetical protein